MLCRRLTSEAPSTPLNRHPSHFRKALWNTALPPLTPATAPRLKKRNRPDVAIATSCSCTCVASPTKTELKSAPIPKPRGKVNKHSQGELVPSQNSQSEFIVRSPLTSAQRFRILNRLLRLMTAPANRPPSVFPRKDGTRNIPAWDVDANAATWK